jgi:hypothetical protein
MILTNRRSVAMLTSVVYFQFRVWLEHVRSKKSKSDQNLLNADKALFESEERIHQIKCKLASLYESLALSDLPNDQMRHDKRLTYLYIAPHYAPCVRASFLNFIVKHHFDDKAQAGARRQAYMKKVDEEHAAFSKSIVGLDSSVRLDMLNTQLAELQRVQREFSALQADKKQQLKRHVKLSDKLNEANLLTDDPQQSLMSACDRGDSETALALLNRLAPEKLNRAFSWAGHTPLLLAMANSVEICQALIEKGMRFDHYTQREMLDLLHQDQTSYEFAVGQGRAFYREFFDFYNACLNNETANARQILQDMVPADRASFLSLKIGKQNFYQIAQGAGNVEMAKFIRANQTVLITPHMTSKADYLDSGFVKLATNRPKPSLSQRLKSLLSHVSFFRAMPFMQKRPHQQDEPVRRTHSVRV